MSKSNTHIAPPDLNRSSVPRYVQLAGLFRRRIETGQWTVGNQIPVIEDLVAECGVARATIRQALGMLESDGLIERHRAKGTFVKRTPQQQLWCEVQTDWSGLLMSRDGAKIDVLSQDENVVPPVNGDPIGALAASYRHLRRRHTRDGVAYLIADIYVESAVAQRITKADYRSKSALRLIADIPGVEVSDARQTLTIGTADIDLADELGIAINDPVAFVHRCAVDANGVIILIANGIYRGDLVRMDMRLK
jgi:GntR family transcriptional regulator